MLFVSESSNCSDFSLKSEMAEEIEDIKPNIGFYNPNIGVYNPNQRQFIEDELRYREKLQQIHTGTSLANPGKFISNSNNVYDLT